MALTIIDGYGGANHITAEQVGDCNAGTYGSENYVLPVGQRLGYEIITNNTIRVYDGAFLIQGRRCCIEANTFVDFTIENGAQGVMRNDILAINYTKDSSTRIESLGTETIKGTPTSGTPTDPEIETGDIRSGANATTMPIYRVELDGLNIVSVTPLFDVLVKFSDIKGFLNSFDEIMAATEEGFVAGALGVKKGFESLNAKIFFDTTQIETVISPGYNTLNIAIPEHENCACQPIYISTSTTQKVTIMSHGTTAARVYSEATGDIIVTFVVKWICVRD